MRGAWIAFALTTAMLAGCAEPADDGVAPLLQSSSGASDAVEGQSHAGRFSTGDDDPKDVPTLVLPPMREGDVARYTKTMQGNESTFVYSVDKATTKHDAHGVSHGVFIVTETAPQEIESSDASAKATRSNEWRYAPDVGIIAGGSGGRTTGEEFGDLETWQLHLTPRSPPLPMCGIFNRLQGHGVPATRELQLLEDVDCVTGTYWVPGADRRFRWSGSGEAGGKAVEWFTDVDAGWRIAFSPDVPYPVRIEGAGAVLQLEEFLPGSGPDAPPAAGPHIDVPPPAYRERGVAGPDDRDAAIPFTLHEAFQAALDDAGFDGLRRFLEAHPDAKAFQASSQAMRQQGPLDSVLDPLFGSTTRHFWKITMVGDGATYHFCVERSSRDGAVSLPAPVSGGPYKFAEGPDECGYSQSGEVPELHALPDMMPDVMPLLSLWRHYAVLDWGGIDATHWGFSYACHEAGCQDPHLSIWTGQQWSTQRMESSLWAVDAVSFDEGLPHMVWGLEWHQG